MTAGDQQSGAILRFAERAFSLRSVATCPDCGASVGQLTNGAYFCDQGHLHNRRWDLDGGVRWWHGRFKLLGITITAVYVLFSMLIERIRGDANGR